MWQIIPMYHWVNSPWEGPSTIDPEFLSPALRDGSKGYVRCCLPVELSSDGLRWESAFCCCCCVALAVLEFTSKTRLASSSQRSACLWLTSAKIRIKGMCHHREVETCFPPPRFIYLLLYTVFSLHVYLHSRRGRQISLELVVSHHVVAGDWTQYL